jgi:hypothetical protein
MALALLVAISGPNFIERTPATCGGVNNRRNVNKGGNTWKRRCQQEQGPSSSRTQHNSMNPKIRRDLRGQSQQGRQKIRDTNNVENTRNRKDVKGTQA